MLQSLVAFVFVLGVIVFVHELGHFLLARRHGVRVLTFSLGFGPKVLTIRRGGTDYCISAIPLGGYVKMAGENPEDPHTGSSDEFLAKSKWQRFQILIAGPAMNVLLAFLVMIGVLYNGAEVPAYESQPVVVGSVLAGSPAERAGIESGDRIVSVAGYDVPTWERFFVTVTPRANRQVEFVVERGGERRTLNLVPDAQTQYEMGDIGVLPEIYPQIRSILPGQPAEASGLAVRDVVVAVDGTRVTRDFDLVKYINGKTDTPITFRVRRDGGERDVTVTPALVDGVGKIGVSFSPFEARVVQPTFMQAVRMSAERNAEWSLLIFRTLKAMLAGEASPRQLMGPVGIAQASGGAAEAGWASLFGLMALISLNLGLVNLFPIPILDGGHILILALEGLARRDFSMRVKEKVMLAGFLVLMALMVTVIYNDLMRIEWISRLVPWS